MKKIIVLLFCFAIVRANATIHNVNVVNFSFSPVTLNVVVGDVIHWVWVNGTHTTTSITIPAGASPWDAPITSLPANNTFDYTVTAVGDYSYLCMVHGIAMSGSFTATSATPVTLSSFNINTQNNKPLITWITQTEVNADYFSIRKSINGTDFKEIGKVPAAGTSAVKKYYSFTDDDMQNAKYVYYALAIVDKDGKTQLSPIKIYKNKTASQKLIVFLSPNPVAQMGHLMLKFNADKPGAMIAKLVDMQGKIILKTELSAVQGINNGHIHLGEVPAGTYAIYFSMDGINETYRIVKN